jgi:T5SS/PEP-CTERM-associated repeat protein
MERSTLRPSSALFLASGFAFLLFSVWPLAAHADITIDPDSIGAINVVQDPNYTSVLFMNPLPDPLDLGPDELAVGNTADGVLAITGGGAVSSFRGYIGNESGSTGEATVDGTGSTWTNSSSLFIGYRAGGSGTLSITGNGLVSIYPLLPKQINLAPKKKFEQEKTETTESHFLSCLAQLEN